MIPLLLNSLDISKVFLDKVGDFYTAIVCRSCGNPGMMMDSSRPVQTKSSFLIACTSVLPFDGKSTGGGKRQALGILPDLALV